MQLGWGKHALNSIRAGMGSKKIHYREGTMSFQKVGGGGRIYM